MDPSPTPFFHVDFSTIDLRVILAAIAIVVAVGIPLYFQWWRNRKRLSYDVLSNEVLISAEKEIEDKVEIKFEGYSVKNVRLLVVKLINDGYQPIKKDDFEKPIKFVFPNAKILTSEKIRFEPEDIATQIAYRDDWLTIDPALFNRKDYVQFKLLLSGYTGMKIEARIIGVSKLGKVRPRLFDSESMFAIGFLLMIAFAVYNRLTTGAPFSSDSIVPLVLFGIAATVSILHKFFGRNR